MTPSELKRQHQKHNPESSFFSRTNMQFFGDTTRNYGCRSGVGVWVLYRKRPVKCGYGNNALFCKKTFQRVQGGTSYDEQVAQATATVSRLEFAVKNKRGGS